MQIPSALLLRHRQPLDALGSALLGETNRNRVRVRFCAIGMKKGKKNEQARGTWRRTSTIFLVLPRAQSSIRNNCMSPYACQCAQGSGKGRKWHGPGRDRIVMVSFQFDEL